MPSSTFERVVQLLSDATHTYNIRAKIECLTQVKELIINKEPSLLDNFLDEFMDFQHDRSPVVRTAVVEFIEQACKLDQDNLQKGVERLVFMVHDDNPNVLKRVIACMMQIYRQCLTLQARAKGVNKTVTETYTAACQIKERILSLTKSDNDGVRTYVVKFMESIIVLHSKRHPESEIPKSRESEISVDQIPVNHRTLRPAKMEEESRRLMTELIRLGQSKVTSVNLQVIMSALASTAKLRPQYMSDVVQAFETMHVNLPPNLAVSQVSSVRKSLKNNLLQILRHPASFDFQTQITTLLTDLGATETEVMKSLPKVDEATRKRKMEAQTAAAQNAVKRAKGLTADDDDEELMTPFVSIGSSAKEAPGTSVLDRTASDLIPKMTSANVTDLVLLSMVVLPDEMPAAFQNTYTPIAAAGTEAQIKHLARMLAAQLVSVGMVEKAPPAPGENISGAVLDDDAVRATPMHISTVIGGPGKEESQPMSTSEDAADTFKLPAAPPPPPKSGRVKPFKLASVTKPLPTELMEVLARTAFERILYVSGLGNREDVQAARVRVLASLTTQFGKHFYPMLVDYIQEDVKHRFQLAIALLYHEFVKCSGFQRDDFERERERDRERDREKDRERDRDKDRDRDRDKDKDRDKDREKEKRSDREKYSPAQFATYDGIITNLLHRFIMLPGAKDQYFGKLILEAPILTDNAFDILKGYCVKERTPGFGFRLLRDLIETRPLKKEEYLSVLLNFAAHDRAEVRTQALDVIKELFIDESERIEAAARERLNLLLLPTPTAAVYPFQPPGQPLPKEWSDEAYKMCLHLFLGVLPLEPALLHELASVYVKTSSQAVKRIILRMLDAPVNGLGMGSPEVLRLVQECPKGAETLIMRVIHILTDKAPPSMELVEHVKELYHNRVSDVRFLIPVLTGLSKNEVINALPKMIQLNEKVVKQVFNRLLGLSAADPNYQSPVTAEELLIELHLVEFHRSEDKDGPAADLKHIIQATQLCFQERKVYTQEKLSIVLNKLVEHTPLPTLLMRTVMQSLGMYNRLVGFVANLLGRLAQKQVWKNAALWEGFIKCSAKMRPQSYPILLQLPPERLQSVFQRSPELRNHLKRHVDNLSPVQRAKINKAVISVLETVPESSPAASGQKPDSENTEPPEKRKRLKAVVDTSKLAKDKERMAEEARKRGAQDKVVRLVPRSADTDSVTTAATTTPSSARPERETTS